MDVQKLFAERIGGEKFGQVKQTFKFTLIDNAKRAFIAQNPGVKVIDMGVGEPEELPRQDIFDSLDSAARRLENRIYPCNGGPRFREAAAIYLRRDFGIELDPASEIMHCIGTKTALAQIPLAFLNPGEAVVATTPGYPVLPRVAEWLGGKMVYVPLMAAEKFVPSSRVLRDVVEKHSPKIFLTNYPNNPTGAVATREFFETLVGLAHEFGFVIVQDAAYADFVFDGQFVSPLQIPGGKEVTLELYSLSKSYNMQGWRLGFVAGAAPLVKAFALIKDNTDNGQFLAIQEAGVHALTQASGMLVGQREKYLRRLRRTVDILHNEGLTAEVSPGTFYLYVAVPKAWKGASFESAQKFTDFLIAKAGLISVPWDEAGAYVRLSMTFEIEPAGFESEDHLFRELSERLRAA
jgi:LL-diaminopimelate aminotransferase